MILGAITRNVIGSSIRIIKSMKRLKAYLRRIYRLSVNYSKQGDLLWDDLKRLFAGSNWKYGIYENEKYIEAIFEIGNEKGQRFFYQINNGYFRCFVNVIENFPVELTTELFILATHFNNLLNNGVVIINIENHTVEYAIKRDILIPLLYTGELYNELLRHHKTSKDIYWAFQKLIDENEAPAIIIADLLKKIKAEEEQNKK